MGKMRDELKDIKQFGMVLAAMLIIFSAAQFIKHKILLSQWFFGAGCGMLCVTLLVPKALRPIYKIFLKVAHAIGWFNTRVILIIIYFVLLCPIAVIMKVAGKDLLNRKIDKGALTYWINRAASKVPKEQLEKQF